jgi:hypothetical protein
LYDQGEVAGNPAEETLARIHDFLGGKPRPGRLRDLLSRNWTDGNNQEQAQGTTQENVHEISRKLT